jgi:predicted DNA binding CopG/RHH family protein
MPTTTKEGFLQVRVSEDLEKKLKKSAKKTHDGNLSAFVRDALHDRVGNIEVAPGNVRLPYSLLALMEEKAKKAGLPLDEFIRFMLTKNFLMIRRPPRSTLAHLLDRFFGIRQPDLTVGAV